MKNSLEFCSDLYGWFNSMKSHRGDEYGKDMKCPSEDNFLWYSRARSD